MPSHPSNVGRYARLSTAEPSSPPLASQLGHVHQLVHHPTSVVPLDDVPPPPPPVGPSSEPLLVNAVSPSLEPRGSLTFLNGLALVVSLQIGSGIFIAPYQVSNHVPSAGVGVLVWLVGGLLVWTGAASFIELGLAIPRTGGVQEYLRVCYGDFHGFLFTWIWVLISKPAAMAIISTVFADSLCRAFQSGETAFGSLKTLVAFLGLTFITIVNCLGAKTGARVANGFLVLKLFALFSICFLGVVVVINGTGDGVGQGKSGWFDNDTEHQHSGPWTQIGMLVTALYGALFAYGGWETIGFVAGEMQDPIRDLPRVINSAMSIVIIGFVLMNIALYIDLPIAVIRGRSTVVVEFGVQVLGPVGGLFYSLIISASAMGSLNANVFATARLCVAASQRGYFPKVLSNSHFLDEGKELEYYHESLPNDPFRIKHMIVRFARATTTLRLQKKVPVYAMIMNWALASFYLAIGTFNGLITFVGISEYFFFFLAVLGIARLRSIKPEGSHSYRTWTFNPVIFSLISGFLVLRGVITDAFQASAIFILIVAGWFIFKYWFREEVPAR